VSQYPPDAGGGTSGKAVKRRFAAGGALRDGLVVAALAAIVFAIYVGFGTGYDNPTLRQRGDRRRRAAEGKT